MRVYRVEHVSVVKASDKPLVLLVQAAGLAASTGWTNARLDPSGDSNPADAVLELGFEADRPDGRTLPVLSPIYATTELRPKQGADAVVVIARTNSLTVHASDFLTQLTEEAEVGRKAAMTTLMVGEEGHPTTLAFGEELPTTLLRGEEGRPTTLQIGEELPTTLRFAEEGVPTTFQLGEEVTTLRFGEEGPVTDPRIDDPAGGATTLAFGEEGPDPFHPGGGYGGPFGGY